MALSQIGTSYDNAFCVPSSSLNARVPSLNSNSRTNGNTSTYFAKKGEPMYMKEMDPDEDGIVSFDEFKDYCKDKGISERDMTKMIQMSNSYRELMNQTSKNNKKKSIDYPAGDLLDKINSKNNNKTYAASGDKKYNEAMDADNDGKVTYKEYIDYCVEHVKTKEQKSNTKVEQTEDGVFKTTSIGKALNAYASSEAAPVKSTYEYSA